PALGCARGAGEVLAGAADLARPDARIAVQVVHLDLARRVVGSLVGRVGRGRAVGRPGRELEEALLAGEEHGAWPAGAAEPGGRLDRVALQARARAVMHELDADRRRADAVGDPGARRDAEAERAEGATEDRTGVVDRAAQGDGCHPVQSRHSADQIEGALERRDRHARAERGGVRVSAEGEVARAEPRRRAEPAEVVALGSAGTGRIALLAADRVHHPVAAPAPALEGAGGRAAVAARRVAVVALRRAEHVAVTAAGDERAGVAAAVAVVRVAVVALLARLDDAVATDGGLRRQLDL